MKINCDYRFCIVLALLVPFNSFGQSDWKVVRLDYNLTFSFPSDYKKTDTLGQENFLGRTDVGYMQAVKIPWPQANVTNERDLMEHYDVFQKSTVERSVGDLVSDSTVKLNDLCVRVFEFENFFNDSLEVQENMIMLIDHSVYSFTYAYFKDEKEKALKEKDAFFTSIATDDVDFEDQLTMPRQASSLERSGELFGYIFRYVTLGALIVTIVLFFLKKYDQVRKIKNIFAMIFLTWGSVCLFLYLGNLFFRNYVNSLLIMGGICLIVGYVSRKVNVPLTRK